jgi:1,4-alpha-glucan branching enzyme
MFRRNPSWKLLVPPTVLAWAVVLVCQAQPSTPPPPLGATPHPGGTTFRVWAPFVDAVSVKVNEADPVPLVREDGHPAPDDTVFIGDVAGAKVGDRYTYLIKANGVTRAFVDPRARRLTSPQRGPASIVVDPTAAPSRSVEPSLGGLVIYELHIGTFNVPPGKATGTFADAIAKLDYLKHLGVSAVEVMPVHENILSNQHKPANFNWGYDPVQLYAVNSSYGTPEDFKRFVQECHDRGLAVILDVVYNHLADDNLLKGFGGATGPGFKDGIFFYGDSRENTGFGPRPDFGRPQVRAYIDDNALMWLREYGVDGLRWDSTINIRAANDGRSPIAEGGQLLRKFNDDYRTTVPKQPQKVSIAEDLQGSADLTRSTKAGGFGFNSQWDDGLWADLRRAVIAVNDADRDIGRIKGSIERPIGDDAFGKVNYSENHDKVGHPNDPVDGKPQIRLPSLIDESNAESVFAKKRATLAAAVVLTAPGIPMLFQGQEMLETQTFDFFNATPVRWQRTTKFKGIVDLYRDLIAVRRNLGGKTGGLMAPAVEVFHADPTNNILAYRRFFRDGGTGHDNVVVVVNLSNNPLPSINLGFPRGGKWVVRFNSGAAVYDPEFKNGDSFDTMANPGDKDGFGFNGNVGIGPYSVVILSQD